MKGIRNNSKLSLLNCITIFILITNKKHFDLIRLNYIFGTTMSSIWWKLHSYFNAKDFYESRAFQNLLQ